MIKALQLIFRPEPTWQSIVAAQRRWLFVFAIHFLPLLAIASVAEGYGLRRWGTLRGAVPHLIVFSPGQTLVFEIAQAVLFILIVLVWAKLIKSFSETFHGRHTFTQAFTTAAYGFSPILLLKMLDGLPAISPWLTWFFGVMLALRLIYSGLPTVLRPDPPHAFGLYLMSGFLLVMITGLARFLTYWYLKGEFVRLDELVSQLLAR